MALTCAMLCAVAALASAQGTTTTTQTKTFEVVAVKGNDLVVKLPEGTRELMVPADTKFTVDGKPMMVSDLKPGMKGTATITTKTTMIPVSVTEVKNGTVQDVTGSSMLVRTDEGFKSFTQGDVDKRGVKIFRDGQPAEISDFHKGDILTATIVTSKPPKIVTEKQVNAMLAKEAAKPASSASSTKAASSSSMAAKPASSASSSASTPSGSAPAKKLPKTASVVPMVGLIGVVSLALGLALMIGRRAFVR
jgi:hypothetical protein